MTKLIRCYCFLLVFWKCEPMNQNFSVGILDICPEYFQAYTDRTAFTYDVNYFELAVELQLNADLVVFPNGLLSYWKEKSGIDRFQHSTYVNRGDNPCLNESIYSDYMVHLSCQVKNINRTVIINAVEKSKCQNESELDYNNINCARWGHRMYNTDIVFGHNGQIVERYRNNDLNTDEVLDEPDSRDAVIFSTDSGVRFGILNFFDLFTKHPSDELLNSVDKFVLLNFRRSELPFLTALQTQQMWSMAHNVQLFSSSTNDPQKGSGGIGAYNGKVGPWYQDLLMQEHALARSSIVSSLDNVTEWENDDATDALAKSMDDFHLSRDDLSKYTSKLLNTRKNNTRERLCLESGFCCNFNINIDFDENKQLGNVYTYHLVAYAGSRSFWAIYNDSVEVCGVIACLNSSLASCGRRFGNYSTISWPVTFEQIRLNAKFGNADNTKTTQYPNSLLSSIRPIHPKKTRWTTKTSKGFVKRIWKLKSRQSRLMTFAIFGQTFSQN